MCVVVKMDGYAVCNACRVLHKMVQHMIYHSNQSLYVQVHGMPPIHGMGRGGWWGYTLVVTGGHCYHGIVHSSTRVHSAYM